MYTITDTIYFGGEMKLYSREWLIENNYPYGKAFEGIPKGDPLIEYKRTSPDVILYNPDGIEYYKGDNEHLLVFESPDQLELLAVWTQSSCEGKGNNHIVMSRSKDSVNWTSPVYIAGTKENERFNQASWAFPIVSTKKRIYLFYTKQLELSDNHHAGSGGLGCIYSDDYGYTWSDEAVLPMVRSRFDNPDTKYPKNWIVWQKPIKDANNKYIAGYTLCTSHVHNISDYDKTRWVNQDSRCYFMRFENIDDNPDPYNIEITWLPDNDKGIEVDNPIIPNMSTAQEPAITLLPDGRIFCIMRTVTGYVYYSTSEDNGHTFKKAQPLRYGDNLEHIKHPLSPAPIYSIKDGLYLTAFHDNDGERIGFSQKKENWEYNMSNFIRNPLYIAIGRFDSNAEQPIQFGKKYKLLDTEDVAVGPKNTSETCTYTSMTYFKDKLMFWYPDRKYYLLGKEITDELIEQIVP